MKKKYIRWLSISLIFIVSFFFIPRGSITFAIEQEDEEEYSFLEEEEEEAIAEDKAAKSEEKKEGGESEIEARSALLMEPISGKILYEKNIDEKFAPASVTKVMTMLLAMEAVDSGKVTLEDKVTCSENAKKMGGSTMHQAMMRQ